MHHTISESRDSLTIYADPEERDELRELKSDEPETWGCDIDEIEFLEPLTSNSELDWIDPADTGDLTDAPMLGITDEEGTVLERWAFMPYETRTFLDDLIENGHAVFTC